MRRITARLMTKNYHVKAGERAQYSCAKRMKHKKLIILLTAMILLICSIVVYAYFTDKKEVSNVFVFGNVDVVPREPNWDSAIKNMVPNEELLKDPQVANNGNKEAVVFAKVDVPINTFTMVNEDGTKGSQITDEIFELGYYQDDMFIKGFSPDWVQLNVTSGEKDGEYRTYIVGYDYILGVSKKHLNNPLSPDETVWAEMKKTTPVFGVIKFKNILENTLSDTKNVNVSFYAVQADWLADSYGTYLTGSEKKPEDDSDGFELTTEKLSKDTLQTIWNTHIATDVVGT